MSAWWRSVRAVFRRELGGYFGSPVAYVFLVVFLVLAGFFPFSVSQIFEQGQADLRPFFEWHPWIYLFLVPAVGMRLWADERRTGSLELLLTLPVTLGQAILGKFLAAWVFLGIALCCTFPMVLTMAYLGDPDFGPILCGYFGSFLMAGAYLSVGAMTSSLTRNQVISLILSVTMLLFFVLAGWPPINNLLADHFPVWLVDIVSGFGILPHFASMERGVLDLRDLVYFASVMVFMLFCNAVILQNRRTA